jgi:2-haloacid dehalogenase/putative hydrolase of the HAD superfamily
MTYRALIFDLDDTLFDFTVSEHIGLEHVYHMHFSGHIERAPYTDLYHAINKDLWGRVDLGELTPAQVKNLRFQQLVEKLGVDVDHLTVATTYETSLSESVIWLEGAERAIDILKRRYKLGIITNGLTNVQTAKCHLAGVFRWCQCVIISEQVALAKPDKRIFELTCERMGIEPHEALMVGDSLTADFRGALNVGMDFCWVNPARLPLPEKYPQPKFIVELVAELPKLLGIVNE